MSSVQTKFNGAQNQIHSKFNTPDGCYYSPPTYESVSEKKMQIYKDEIVRYQKNQNEQKKPNFPPDAFVKDENILVISEDEMVSEERNPQKPLYSSKDNAVLEAHQNPLKIRYSTMQNGISHRFIHQEQGSTSQFKRANPNQNSKLRVISPTIQSEIQQDSRRQSHSPNSRYVEKGSPVFSFREQQFTEKFKQRNSNSNEALHDEFPSPNRISKEPRTLVYDFRPSREHREEVQGEKITISSRQGSEKKSPQSRTLSRNVTYRKIASKVMTQGAMVERDSSPNYPILTQPQMIGHPYQNSQYGHSDVTELARFSNKPLNVGGNEDYFQTFSRREGSPENKFKVAERIESISPVQFRGLPPTPGHRPPKRIISRKSSVKRVESNIGSSKNYDLNEYQIKPTEQGIYVVRSRSHSQRNSNCKDNSRGTSSRRQSPRRISERNSQRIPSIANNSPNFSNKTPSPKIQYLIPADGKVDTIKFASMKQDVQAIIAQPTNPVTAFNPHPVIQSNPYHLPKEYKPRHTLEISANTTQTQNTTMLSTNMSNLNPNASIIQGQFSKDNPYFQKASAWEKKKKEIIQRKKQEGNLSQHSKPPLFKKSNRESQRLQNRYLQQPSVNTVSLNTESYTTQYTPLNQDTLSNGISNMHLISKDTGDYTPGKTPTRKIAFQDDEDHSQSRLREVVKKAHGHDQDLNLGHNISLKTRVHRQFNEENNPNYGIADYYSQVNKYAEPELQKEKGKIRVKSRRTSTGHVEYNQDDYFSHLKAAEMDAHDIEHLKRNYNDINDRGQYKHHY